MKRWLPTFSVGLAAITFANPQPASAIGGQFGMEFAVDAPWRIEPIPLGGDSYAYSPIPITISFHDTIFEDGRGELAKLKLSRIAVGQFVGVRVSEIGTNAPPVTDIPVSAMEEIEVKRDLSTKQGEPIHRICRPSTGQDCGDLIKISDTHEWNGVFWYTPQTPVALGRNLYLKVTVKTVAKSLVRLPGPLNVYTEVQVPKEWTNHLVVHAGEAPLPRFGADWLYGDVHYHSQMTDNEGESAYSYRNVARALGASGMDFVFATDHASNGNQVDGKVDGKIEARDLNRPRFAAAKGILYGPDGANQLVVNEASRIGFPRFRTANTVPQVYMGEELDAWPEMSPKEFDDGFIYYGDIGLYGGGSKYNWLWAQDGFTDCVGGHFSPGFDECKARYAKPTSASKETYLLFDDQGIPVSQEIDGYVPGLGSALNYGEWIPDSVEPYPSRQHLVYFPVDASLSAAGWIGSDTGRFGGGKKRIHEIAREIERGGFAFLAHPVEESEPGSIKGPDVVPYTEVALTRAWSSPAILGLQFWNENDRYRSQPGELDPTVVAVKKTTSPQGFVTSESYTYQWPFPGYFPDRSAWRWQQAGRLHRTVMASTFDKLHKGAAAWDRYLRKGLDPLQTRRLSWLSKGEPRKWFMAGGSDAHGDWNYRRGGRPSPTERWSDYPVSDTAIGNPRNLVSMKAPPTGEIAPASTARAASTGGPRRYTNREVIESFRAGRFSVTDGPALRIAIDKNRNGKIDHTDFQMGSTINFFPGEHIPLLVEWQSTVEFGPIDQIDLYVGNRNVTYAGKNHGSRLLPFYVNSQQRLLEEYGGYQPDPSGVLQIKLADSAGYFSRTDAPDSVRYHGVARVYLGPSQFKLADYDHALSYVRAFARTISDQQGEDTSQCPRVGDSGSKCGDRFAYSNPIWAKFEVACPSSPARPRGGPLSSVTAFGDKATPYLDANGDGVSDVCAVEIPNPCPGVAVAPGDRSTENEQPRDSGGGRRAEIAIDPSRPPPRATEEALARPQPTKPVPNFSCVKVVAPT
jgi:hypothetical protein